MSTQWWRDVTFVHWPVEPSVVRPLMPGGVRPDVLDGQTYVGLVAFRMDRVGVAGSPGLPYLGRFAETNVRLYSVDSSGRRGVVFRSMDANRLLPVLAARAGMGLPYLWSRMSVVCDGDHFTYTARRRWPSGGGITSSMSVRVGPPLRDPTELEHFLTARWGLHRARGGRTSYLPNAHPRWRLHRAELTHLADSFVSAAGLRVTGPPVSVLWSPGVPARFDWPQHAD
ncbi:DUF2071 domain-containing protein [Saccharopolyspora sp. K220]|nr:DUF2071 domain-containing protein [Saccharopolyspora soli]